MRKHHARREGFTLVELVVVIAIIALIIGLLIPSLKQSLRLAYSTVCSHNLRDLSQGVSMYRYEHDGWLPLNTGRPRAWGPRLPDSGVWFTKLHPTYLPEPMVLSCPEDPFRYKFQEVVGRRRLSSTSASDFMSYGVNSFITNAARGKLANLDRYRSARPVETILLGDLGPDDELRRTQVTSQPVPMRNASLLSWDDGYDPFVRNGRKPWLTGRHVDGINMATIDGSARMARTHEAVKTRVMSYYPSCAAGGCTLCNEVRIPHYSFARSRLYWWTGPLAIVE